MKAPKLLIHLVVSATLTSTLMTHAGPEVDRLLEGYARIETVSCQIRRTKEGAAGKIKFLSRVYWCNNDKLHAEGITPVKRRTIADGRSLWQYAEGDPKGFSRPISELSEAMTISLKLVPGTAMDHLLRLKGLEETALPATADGIKQIGVQTETQYTILQLDTLGRLIGIEFYTDAQLKKKVADYDYRNFCEALPGVWVPLTHEANIQIEKVNFKETVKVDRFAANQPVAESLFIESSFFDKGIDFVDEFEKIYPQ